MYFFFNDTATTEIYTLSLHDALPISRPPKGVHRRVERDRQRVAVVEPARHRDRLLGQRGQDRKSTRLNSSHANISYAVFCLKKKKISSQFCLITTPYNHLIHSSMHVQ